MSIAVFDKVKARQVVGQPIVFDASGQHVTSYPNADTLANHFVNLSGVMR